MKIYLKRWLKSAFAASLLMGASLFADGDVGGTVYATNGMVLHEQVLDDTGLGGNDSDAGGNSVAIDGEWAFVANTDWCQVFVYKYDYITNRWGDGAGTIGRAYTTLNAAGAACSSANVRQFGYSLSTDNGMVAVGAPTAGLSPSDNYGMVYIFKFDPAQVGGDTADNRNGWIRIGTVEQARDYVGGVNVLDTQDFSHYGWNVSIRYNENGNGKAILVIGAPNYGVTINSGAKTGDGSNEGKVYAWEWDDGLADFTLVDGEIGQNPYDEVGTYVTSNGAELLASAPYFDGNVSGTPVVDSGAVYLFGYSVDDHNFTLEHKFESNL